MLRPHRLVGPGRRPLTPITGVRVPLGTHADQQKPLSIAFIHKKQRLAIATLIPNRYSETIQLILYTENQYPYTGYLSFVQEQSPIIMIAAERISRLQFM